MEVQKLKTLSYIDKLRKNFVRISSKQEEAIVDYFGKNISNEFTEQDIWEQTRKIIDNN